MKKRNSCLMIAVAAAALLIPSSYARFLDLSFDDFFQDGFSLPDPFDALDPLPLRIHEPVRATDAPGGWHQSMLHRVEREMQRVQREMDRLSKRHEQLQERYKQLLSEGRSAPFSPVTLPGVGIEAREQSDRVTLTVHNVTLPGNLDALFVRGPSSLSLQTNEGVVSAHTTSNSQYGPMLEYSVSQQQQETQQQGGKGQYAFYGSFASSSESRGAMSVNAPLNFETASALYANGKITITIPKG